MFMGELFLSPLFETIHWKLDMKKFTVEVIAIFTSDYFLRSKFKTNSFVVVVVV